MIATSVIDQLTARAARESVQQVVAAAIVEVDGAVLLLQRRRYNGLGGGALELPTGEVGRRESLMQALTRGVTEKTGLAVTDVGDYVGSFDYLSASGQKCRQMNFSVQVAAPDPVQLTEHYAYRWIPVDAELPVTRSVREVFRKYRNIHHV